jgi:hypothetical protein
MLTALLTSPVSAIVENVRATIIFETQSSMAQQWTLPSRAGCSVTSAHHSSLGRVAVNWRLTRPAGVCRRNSNSPRRHPHRRPNPASPTPNESSSALPRSIRRSALESSRRSGASARRLDQSRAWAPAAGGERVRGPWLGGHSVIIQIGSWCPWAEPST